MLAPTSHLSPSLASRFSLAALGVGLRAGSVAAGRLCGVADVFVVAAIPVVVVISAAIAAVVGVGVCVCVCACACLCLCWRVHVVYVLCRACVLVSVCTGVEAVSCTSLHVDVSVFRSFWDLTAPCLEVELGMINSWTAEGRAEFESPALTFLLKTHLFDGN